MNFLRIFYIVLHFFVSHLFDLHYYFSQLALRVKLVINGYQLRPSSSSVFLSKSIDANFDYELKLLQNVASELRRLKKLPNHIACLFLEKKFETESLLKIIRWCCALDVSSISFFDHQGIIAGMEDDIKAKFDDLTFYSSNYQGKLSLKIYRGFTTENTKTSGHINLYLMAHQDGKAKFASIAKEIASNSISIQQSDIERRMNGVNPGEPDVLLQFGSLQSNTTLGYPPWYLRLTQMMRLPDHNVVRIDDFSSAMLSYGSSQQRYGR